MSPLSPAPGEPGIQMTGALHVHVLNTYLNYVCCLFFILEKNTMILSNSERTKWYAEMKRQKRAKQKYESKQRQRPTNACILSSLNSTTKSQSQKRQERRVRVRERKQYQRDRKRKWRAKTKDPVTADMQASWSPRKVFKYRTDKKRALDRMKQALPVTPIKRCAVLKSYLTESKSPTAKKLNIQMNSPTDEVANSVLKNVKQMISESKLKRSKEKRTETHTLIASVSGENLTENRSKAKLARQLGVSVKTISGGQRLRTKILTSSKSCWEHTKRKGRSDGITEEQKSAIYNFWISPQVSRPTGNKRDVKRHRIGPKTYLSHSIHILEKTQTEAYTDFKVLNPDLKISQRTFEKYKPFFVKPVRVKDKCTCCCRYHVEFGHAFRRCMQLRAALRKKHNITSEDCPVFDHSSDLIEKTLCERQEGKFRMSCLNRECTSCGVRRDLFMPAELDVSESAEEVDWERYEYRNFTHSGTQVKRKLVLVKKKTKIGELYQHLISLLETFPSHNFRADWQHTQAKRLIETLPAGDVLVVHDYSENYRCTEKNEIQSSYFQKTEVSIHVSIIYRHAILEHDGVESMPDDPRLIQEQFFVISPDRKHDHHFTFHVQNMMHEYLMSISYPLQTIHEYTDGCAAQYKSRHCLGSLTQVATKLNCTIVRNFYETSHAKGPQDAAGGYLKQQADLAVLRGKTIIQSAKDFYDFVSEELSTPKQSAVCKSRIFRYVPEIPRNEASYFKQIPSIRKIHQVKAMPSSNSISSRFLSCYSCDACCQGDFVNCEFHSYTGVPTITQLVGAPRSDEEDQNETETDTCMTSISNLIHVGHIIAVRAEDDDFYLFEAKSEPFTLPTDKTDDYQTTYSAGTSVIEGLYYERQQNSTFNYRLLPKHKAIVPTLSVVRICSEVHGKRFKLPEAAHQSIVDSCDEISC